MCLSRTTEILADLIAFQTVSADSNLEIIRYLTEWLEARCVLTRDETGAKANVFARWDRTCPVSSCFQASPIWVP